MLLGFFISLFVWGVEGGVAFGVRFFSQGIGAGHILENGSSGYVLAIAGPL